MSFDDLRILRSAIRRAIGRAWWLLALAPLLAGLAVFWALKPAGPTYEARTTVVATRTALPIEQLLATAAELFTVGGVDRAVATGSGLTLDQATANIGLRPVPGAPVFYVTGRGSTPEAATEMSTLAAAAFLAQTEGLDDLGRFTVFAEAEPADATRAGNGLPAVAGLAAGALMLGTFLAGLIALEGPFRPVRTTQRLSRSLGRPVGLVWVEGRRVAVGDDLRQLVAADPVTDWRVRALDDVDPDVLDAVVGQLEAIGPEGARRTGGAKLTLVPADASLGSILIDRQLTTYDTGPDTVVGLLVRAPAPDPPADPDA